MYVKNWNRALHGQLLDRWGHIEGYRDWGCINTCLSESDLDQRIEIGRQDRSSLRSVKFVIEVSQPAIARWYLPVVRPGYKILALGRVAGPRQSRLIGL